MSPPGASLDGELDAEYHSSYGHEETGCHPPATGNFDAVRAKSMVSTIAARKTGGAEGPPVGGRQRRGHHRRMDPTGGDTGALRQGADTRQVHSGGDGETRSEEHTSELQSLRHLVCRL